MRLTPHQEDMSSKPWGKNLVRQLNVENPGGRSSTTHWYSAYSCGQAEKADLEGQAGTEINYLCTYDLYGPMRNGFDAGRYLCGEVGGGGSWRWKSRVLWAPVKLHEPIDFF
jgi:hypothetical protein